MFTQQEVQLINEVSLSLPKLKLKVIQQEAANQSLVLFIGPTGAGKSTLINYLHGSRYQSIKGLKKQLKLCNDICEVAEVGHEATISKTLLPNIYELAGNEFKLLDLSGFGDTRSLAHKVAGGIAADYVIHVAKEVEAIVATIDLDSLISGKEGFLRMISTLKETLGVLQQVDFENIVFAITKTPGDVSSEAIFETFVQPKLSNLQQKSSLSAEEIEEKRFYEFLSKHKQKLIVANAADHGESSTPLLEQIKAATAIGKRKVNILKQDHAPLWEAIIDKSQQFADLKSRIQSLPERIAELEKRIQENQLKMQLERNQLDEKLRNSMEEKTNVEQEIQNLKEDIQAQKAIMMQKAELRDELTKNFEQKTKELNARLDDRSPTLIQQEQFIQDPKMVPYKIHGSKWRFGIKIHGDAWGNKPDPEQATYIFQYNQELLDLFDKEAIEVIAEINGNNVIFDEGKYEHTYTKGDGTNVKLEIFIPACVHPRNAELIKDLTEETKDLQVKMKQANEAHKGAEDEFNTKETDLAELETKQQACIAQLQNLNNENELLGQSHAVLQATIDNDHKAIEEEKQDTENLKSQVNACAHVLQQLHDVLYFTDDNHVIIRELQNSAIPLEQVSCTQTVTMTAGS